MKTISFIFILGLGVSLFARASQDSCRLDRDEIKDRIGNPSVLYTFLLGQGCQSEKFTLPAYGGPRFLERVSFLYTWDWRGGIAGTDLGECFKKSDSSGKHSFYCRLKNSVD
jgi:hypothetical protein